MIKHQYINSIIITLLAASAVFAADPPAPWFHPDGTLHYYQAVSTPEGVTWEAANVAALNSGGYLATITSEEENDLLYSLVQNDEFWFVRPNGLYEGPWLGGFQIAGAIEPDGGWRWMSGEEFDYTNWSTLAPNNRTGHQNRIHLGGTESMKHSTWNDIDENLLLAGYVIEYSAEDQTVGLFQYDRTNTSDGYILYSAQFNKYTYLLDNWGREVHSWTSDYTIKANYLKENGNLISTVALPGGTNPRFAAGGFTGRVEEFDWEGNLVWEFEYSSEDYMTHHDIAVLPNGNVLMIAWELVSEEDAIAAGRNPENLSGGELWPDKIIEVAPTYPRGGNIVWEWRLWDHLIQDFDPTKQNYGAVEEHPELFDINFLGNFNPGGADWNHANAIDYNADLDQIMISSRNQNELWIIDHSTTTEEAAGHTGGNSGRGGDILYRWGNPQSYRAGTAEDQKFFGQHNTQWIAPGLPGAGNILVYNNGNQRPDGSFSTVEEIVPPVDSNGHYTMPTTGQPYAPAEPIWIYTHDPMTELYTAGLGSAERQPNGNTLIGAGFTGRLYEVTPALDAVWHYINPVTGNGPLVQGVPTTGNGKGVFRATRYAPDFPGFTGRDMTPDMFLELYPSPAPVVVELMPLVTPMVIPPEGGDLDFGITLENISASEQVFDAWIDIAYESGDPTTVVQRTFSNFASGFSLNRPDAYYPIPSTYEAGNYVFSSTVGSYPDEIWDTSSFAFEKSGVSENGFFEPFAVDGAPDPFGDLIAENILVPVEHALLSNYPNPFNPVTTINFSIPEANRVQLSVYDISGRLVAELVNGYRIAGSHQAVFDASNLASGVYFYQLTAGNLTAGNKMVLVK